MHVPTLIARKREGETLSPSEIGWLVDGYVRGDVEDYQMSAFAMAVFFKGMTAAETAALTLAMMRSGDVFQHPLGATVVDKHSTGGIGDKVSLILAPLVACAGCRVPMVSGRGLGITGGTLDKLESIPGFRVGIGMDEAAEILAELGVVMMGQTDRFCPADRKLYALRDVTGTVPSIPLITASIMSKKMAESLERLVLDVKYGSGAFMKTRADAELLAEGMVAVGKEMGVEVFAVINPMSEPTGRAVGNALEVIEALECLDGGGPEDLRKVVLDLSETIAGIPRAAGNGRGAPGLLGAIRPGPRPSGPARPLRFRSLSPGGRACRLPEYARGRSCGWQRKPVCPRGPGRGRGRGPPVFRLSGPGRRCPAGQCQYLPPPSACAGHARARTPRPDLGTR